VSLPVKARAVDGVRIRHAPGHSELLGRAGTPSDGRWQRARVTSALYLADTRETATAEWYRSLAEQGLYPDDYLPFDHHQWRVGLELADLSTREHLDAVGLSEPVPNRRSWPAFQTVGEQLFADGWPRARRPERSTPGLADRVHLHRSRVATGGMHADRFSSQRSGPPSPTGDDHLIPTTRDSRRVVGSRF